jgi:RNase P/RNase MRP subunit p30
VLADLCYEGDLDQFSTRLLTRLGYRVVASSRVSESLELEGLRVVPRVTVRRGELPVRGFKGVRVLLVESEEDLKAYQRLRGLVDSVRVDYERLGDVDKDFIRRLVGLGLPVELVFTDLLRRVLGRSSIDFYLLLLRLYTRGRLRVYLCSGAGGAGEIAHPEAMASLLTSLGVPEPYALGAVYRIPEVVLGGCYLRYSQS